jgi:hypothetical protein
MARSLAVAALLGAALLVSACGASGKEGGSSTGERPGPAAAAREFLAASAAEDAEAFCRITLPSIRQPNFATAGVAGDGSCEEKAEAMFEYHLPGGAEPFWELARHARVASIKLGCKPPERQHCPTATAMVENLPAPEGGTTGSVLPLSLESGRWLVGTSPG